MSQKSTKTLICLYQKGLINREAKKIAKTFDVTDRLDTMAKQECFTTLKDHK